MAARAAWEASRFLPNVLVGSDPGGALVIGAGFQLCHTCPPSPPTHVSYGTASSCSGALVTCPTRYALAAESPVASAHNALASQGHMILHKIRVGDPFGERYDRVATYTRTVPGVVAPGVTLSPARPAILVPDALPMPAPVAMAGGNNRPNSPFRQSGNGVPPVITGDPPPTNRGNPRRPGKKQRERKFGFAGPRSLLGLLRWGLEGTMEALELLEIAHSTLPPKCKSGGKTAVSMFQDIYNCSDGLDGCALAQGLINNAIEDRVFGMLGKVNQGAARNQGSPRGPASGLSGLNRAWLNAPGEDYREDNPYALSIPKINLGCGKLNKGVDAIVGGL